MKFFLFLFFLYLACPSSWGQQVDFTQINFKRFYKVGKNKSVFMPLGEISFVDRVTYFKPGKPRPRSTNTNLALGAPDFKNYPGNTYLSLGCGGELVVEFNNNGFINIDGPDLYFFEVGPSVEAFDIEISTDGKNWIYVGNSKGGSSYIDIEKAEKGKPKQIYYYIKLKDLGSFCSGPSSGADIDAIGTIGGVLKVSIEANLLFDTAKHELRETAIKTLESFIAGLPKIPKGEIIIQGHTDFQGSNNYNKRLATRRAKSVKAYLLHHIPEIKNYKLSIESRGEESPVANNDTEDGRQKNRRVEIVVIPDKEFYKPPR